MNGHLSKVRLRRENVILNFANIRIFELQKKSKFKQKKRNTHLPADGGGVSDCRSHDSSRSQIRSGKDIHYYTGVSMIE